MVRPLLLNETLLARLGGGLAVASTLVGLSLLWPMSGAAQPPAASAICPPTTPAEGTALATSEAGTATSPNPLTPQQVVVACVGPQEITEATFQHWSAVARAAVGPDAKHKPSARELMKQEQVIVEEVMGFLISDDWVIGEAADLKVRVSQAELQKHFHEVREQQFPKLREFRKFLRETKQTVADLLMRVELDMLSNRIQRRIMAGHKSAQGRMRALTHFIRHFRSKWTAKTYCVPQYAVRDCGHVQAIG
jgi:hypothetical protein